MRVVLCPVDFSENSLKALEYAAAISAQTKTKLFILNKFTLTGGEKVEVRDNVFDKTKEEAEEKLNELRNIIQAEHKDLVVDVSVAYGIEPSQVILDFAEEIKADLIVMGTKGAGGFKEIFFGTTTTSVTSKASVPVLAFPVTAKPILPKSIVYATDLKREDEAVLYPLWNFAVILDAPLTFLYVAKDEEKGIDVIRKEMESSEGFTRIRRTLQVRFAEVKSNDVFGAIQDFANETNAGLIVLGNHQKNYLEKLRKGDLTRLMTMYTEVPLLILHKNK
ncbi:uspa domain-containing protein [Sporocytophaga myxococcoides]|uniref:Uspa domain-containing protein n=1 Tax=Sporocytophaga myxococcoides TaxID=153721 RepID=A0A098LGF6_9BACT|nr:universal stress protein [Sporocytophaga myxococcoides]GAL85173.1 uspa domain-containing protein [Sporocytophaga myxococcoides]